VPEFFFEASMRSFRTAQRGGKFIRGFIRRRHRGLASSQLEPTARQLRHDLYEPIGLQSIEEDVTDLTACVCHVEINSEWMSHGGTQMRNREPTGGGQRESESLPRVGSQ